MGWLFALIRANSSFYAACANMAIGRVVAPEILDGLPADDPRARRARRDLRTINAFMGNHFWVKHALRRAMRKYERPDTAGGPRFLEIGAGDGRLCRKVSSWFPGATVTGFDLSSRPPRLPGSIFWKQGNLFEHLPNSVGEVLLGVMILHHFPTETLMELGRMLSKCRVLCFCEPWRVRFAHFLGLLMRPWCGEVTRHDLPVSIDAGFVSGELRRLLGLERWHVEESVDWRGSLRLLAWRG
jgi:SAM-dependent methyltransferase